MTKKVLITAGPTHEALDPVRFIGNHSSGKMGYALAEAFASRGADVILVSGPVNLYCKHPAVRVLKVTSADQMFKAVEGHIGNVDLAVFAAAVADFTPEHVADRKMKRGIDDLVIRLKATRDIAFEMGKLKKSGQFFVGFALETEAGVDSALKKLEKKNLDMIVLNSLQDQGAGFGTDTNKISIIDKSGNIDIFDLKKKTEVAEDILDSIIKLMQNA